MTETNLGPPVSLHTEFGELSVRYIEAGSTKGVVASSSQALDGPIPVRIHSSCLLGEALLAQDCDCRSQLWHSLSYIARHGGHVVYVYDEGRGAGLSFKLSAIALQHRLGLDTAAAYVSLGQAPDSRDYRVAIAAVVQLVGARDVCLLTNNPRKLEALLAAGVNVVDRVPLIVPQSEAARNYLDEKVRVLGHLRDVRPRLASVVSTLPELWPKEYVTVELHVPDFVGVRKFYNALGFEEVWMREPDVDKGYLVLRLEHNVICFWAGNEAVYEHSYFRHFPRLTPRGYGVEIVLTLSDLAPLYSKASALGCVQGELRRRPWGLTDFRFVDPMGYYIRATEKHSIVDPSNAVP